MKGIEFLRKIEFRDFKKREQTNMIVLFLLRIVKALPKASYLKIKYSYCHI